MVLNGTEWCSMVLNSVLKLKYKWETRYNIWLKFSLKFNSNIIQDGHIYPTDSVNKKRGLLDRTQQNYVEDMDMLQDRTSKKSPAMDLDNLQKRKTNDLTLLNKIHIAPFMIMFCIITVLLALSLWAVLYIRFLCIYFNCKCWY